jgi:hypothetical protein
MKMILSLKILDFMRQGDLFQIELKVVHFFNGSTDIPVCELQIKAQRQECM